MSQFDPHKHHRRSIRLKDWDYRSAGYYFVTICTHQRENLFETAVFQEITAHAIERIPNQKHTAHVELDEWIVMPNHIHLILIFLEIVLSERVGTSDNVFQNAPAGSLGVVVGRYKTAVTTRINQLRQTPGGKVWQRGYYERIIRNEREWRATQQYIQNNPTRWAEDRENLDTLLTKMIYRP